MLNLTNHSIPASKRRATAPNPLFFFGSIVLLTLAAIALCAVPASAAQIFVTNFDDGTIETYTTAGASVNRPLVSNLIRPTGIAVAGSNVFVAKYFDSTGTGSIAEYTTDGQLVNAALIPVLYHPTSIAVSGNNLYVTNNGITANSGTVNVYTTAGKLVGSGLARSLSNPVGIAVSDTKVFVVSAGSGGNGKGMVGEYTTAGVTVNKNLITGLNNPGGITIAGGNLFVTNIASGTVGEYTLDGQPINTALITGLDSPGPITALGSHLYITNEYLGTISEYTTAGVPVNTALVTGLSYPRGIAIVPEPAAWILLAAGIGMLFVRGSYKSVVASIKNRFQAKPVFRAMLVAILVVVAITTFAGNARATDLSNSLALTYSDGQGHTMAYRLFLPDGFGTPGEEFPLVLFLHGSGESGTDNTDQVTNHIDGLISATRSGPYSAFLLAPQLPTSSGFGSYNPQDLTMQILQQVEAAYPVETNRMYITGLSMGGFGTFEYISEFPNLFAAAVPLSGGGDDSPQNAEAIKNVPTWIFHGDADQTVPVGDSVDMYQAIANAGGHPKMTIIPGGPHDIWEQVYGDATVNQYGVYPWMFSQQLSTSIPEPSTLVLVAAGVIALAASKKRWRWTG
jgi:predicted esterase